MISRSIIAVAAVIAFSAAAATTQAFAADAAEPLARACASLELVSASPLGTAGEN